MIISKTPLRMSFLVGERILLITIKTAVTDMER